MIIRRKYTKNFCIMPGEVFEDRRLSLDALGLLSYLRSRPDDWSVSLAHLSDLFGVGKDKMQRIMRELIDTGWVVRQTARAVGRGTFAGSDYVVNDEPSDSAAGASPQPENQATAKRAAPQPGLPAPGDPEPENTAAYLESNLTKDSSPLNPPTGGGRRAQKLLRGNGVSAAVQAPPAANRPAATVLESAAAGRFDRLVEAFPEAARGHTRDDRAREIWAGMSAEEQLLAIAAAASYRAQLAKSGLQAKGLHGWLAQRRWVNFRPVHAAAATASASPAAGARVFVEEGSPAWEAWMAYRQTRGEGRCPTTSKAGHANPGWHFPSEYPPAAGGAARVA